MGAHSVAGGWIDLVGDRDYQGHCRGTRDAPDPTLNPKDARHTERLYDHLPRSGYTVLP